MAANGTSPYPGPGGPPGAWPADISKLPTDSKQNVVIGVSILCMVLGTSAVTARLYTRFFIVRRLGIDDGFAFASMVRYPSKQSRKR